VDQGSVYLTKGENLANLMLAMSALKAVPRFPKVVRDIRAFRVEQWSDFTGFIKSS
jgi:virulence-associated protein VapD